MSYAKKLSFKSLLYSARDFVMAPISTSTGLSASILCSL